MCVRRSEIPKEQYERLRVELFSAIAQCSSRSPRLVIVQLCRCLVAFAFATIPDYWPNTVVSMIHSLRSAMQRVQVSWGGEKEGRRGRGGREGGTIKKWRGEGREGKEGGREGL